MRHLAGRCRSLIPARRQCRLLARDILRTALAQEPAETRNLADAIRELVEPLGGVELELPPRGPTLEPPDFK